MARRQARAEAREIRMRELERQQREQEENADRQFDMLTEPLARVARTTGNRYLSSRRSSEDSLEDGGSIRDLRVNNFLLITFHCVIRYILSNTFVIDTQPIT